MNGKGARKKGIAYELFIIDQLKTLGFEAISARSESKNLDDKGCDIVTNAPISVQCKALERLSIPTHELLKNMAANNLEMPVVMHKRNNKGTVVSLRLEDFWKLLIDAAR